MSKFFIVRREDGFEQVYEDRLDDYFGIESFIKSRPDIVWVEEVSLEEAYASRAWKNGVI